MRANELCPSPHLEAADLQGESQGTIVGVELAAVGEEKTIKGVVRFEEFTRGFVLNRTNLKRIIRQHGSETDDWIGKTITLYASETEFKGESVPCIRVRET